MNCRWLVGGLQHFCQLFQALFFKSRDMPQAVPPDLQAADGLLIGFLEGAADAHDLAYRLHLGGQLVLGAFELFKRPFCKLDDHIVPVGNVFGQVAVLPAGDLVQRKPRRQHRRYQCDGEARRLGRQRRRTGGPGVYFDDHDPVGHRVMGKLHVGAADDAYGFHNPHGLLLKPHLQLFGNGQHGGGAEAVAGVYPQRVDVFDEADGDHLSLAVPDNLQLQLFPTQDGLLHQHLPYDGGLDAPADDGLQLLIVVDEASACAAHGEGRTDHDGVAQLLYDRLCLFHGIGRSAPGHIDPQLLHSFLESDPVLAPLDGVDLNADDLYVILV